MNKDEKKCVTSCGANEKIDSTGKKCLSSCPDKEFENTLSKKCGTTCPAGAISDGGECKCPQVQGVR